MYFEGGIHLYQKKQIHFDTLFIKIRQKIKILGNHGCAEREKVLQMMGMEPRPPALQALTDTTRLRTFSADYGMIMMHSLCGHAHYEGTKGVTNSDCFGP